MRKIVAALVFEKGIGVCFFFNEYDGRVYENVRISGDGAERFDIHIEARAIRGT